MMPATLPEKVVPNRKLHVAIALDGRKQYEIAIEAGLWPAVLSNIKQGQRTPGPEIKQRIADVLGMPVSELFDDAEDA